MGAPGHIPFEAFDDDHPDHQWYVDSGWPCRAGSSCIYHGQYGLTPVDLVPCDPDDDIDW